MAGITVLALGVRLFLWEMEPVISRDGVYYLETARRFSGVSGEVIPEYFFSPPLWIGILGVFFRLGWDTEFWGMGVNLFAGVLLPLVVCCGMLELKQSRMAALAAAALVAVHPSAAALSVVLQRESLYLLCCAVMAVMALRAAHSVWWWGVAGVMAGFAAMLRFETMEFVLLAGCGFLYCVAFRITGWRRSLAALGLYGLGMCLGGLLVFIFLSFSLPYLDISPMKYFENALGKVLPYIS